MVWGIRVTREQEISVDNFCIAKNARLSKYNGFCEKHGRTPFDMKLRRCIICGARAKARRAGDTMYVANCDAHGTAAFSVQHGKCLQCFTTAGTRRVGEGETVGARAAARRSGDDTYMEACPKHGETPHAVRTGKCLQCYTTAGTRRKVTRLEP